MTSLLALGHFHLVIWVISLSRLFSGLERGKMSLGGRELLRDGWGGGGIYPKTQNCLRRLSEVFWIIDVLGLP